MSRNEVKLPWHPTKARNPSGHKKNELCVFFARGNCRHGEMCSYFHEQATQPSGNVSKTTTGNPKPSVPPGNATKTDDTRGEVVCRFYAKGRCLNGGSCPFAHPDTALGDQTLAQDNGPVEEPDDGQDSWIRDIGGALVQFGEGASVVKTSLPSDFSAVRISMLPPDSDKSSVSKLFSGLGFTVSPEDIRLPPRGNASHCVADVRVEDPTFAKRFCAAATRHRSINVITIGAAISRTSNTRRVECKKIHCSWYRPVRTVWLNFETKGVATAVDARFSSGKSTICGQTAKSNGVTGSKNRHNSQAWTVMLTEVPADATKSDIVHTFPKSIRPTHIELGEPSYKSSDLAMANAIIKSKVMEVGPLDFWDDASPGVGGKRAKARGRFLDEGDATTAAAALDGWKLPFNNKLQLNVQAIYSARFKVPDRIYKAVEMTIEAEKASAWSIKHVFFTPYSPSPANGQRVLRLEGADNAAVAGAKGALEKILAGEVAVDKDGNAIWTPSFAVSSSLFQNLKSLEERLGVTIVRNSRLSRLHLFGPAEKCKEAQGLLAKMAAEDASASRTVPLTEEQFLWACHGGFKGLCKTLGPNKAVFDIISTPKQITITGTDKDLRLALDMVATLTKETSTGKKPETAAATEAQDCPICLTEAEAPAIVTSCGHTYCPDCFERFCFNPTASSNSDKKAGFIIRCAGDSNTCQQPLSLTSVQEHLPSSTFESLLTASFTSHLRQHPESLRYCPTPDCEQIYRVSSTSTNAPIFTCPQCLTSLCTNCHASPAHASSMSCAEHLHAMSGGDTALEETKKRLGIKDCPRCKTSIEKTEGCNHMTCGGCKTHICWKCLATFDTGGKCYDHLSRVHGGAFEY